MRHLVSGHAEIVQLLCRARADIDKRSTDGSTALHTASHYGHAEIVQLLCGTRADIDKRMTDVAQLLCGARADIDKPANDIATPFVIASQNRYVEAPELLHQAGANVKDITKTP